MMDRDTLYELRSTLALYPYFQTARLLMLQNLFILHDPSFDEELRKAAIYIADRKVLFKLVEAAHYSIKRGVKREQTGVKSEQREVRSEENRTVTLIDNFLDTIPVEPAPKEKRRRQPTPADATVDYVAYLMEVDESEDGNTEEEEGKPIM